MKQNLTTLLFATGALACSSSAGSGFTPAETEIAPSSEGSATDSDASGGRIRLDLGGGGSGPLEAGGRPGCAQVNVSIEPAIGTVTIVVDQSGSMRDSFGNGLPRWDAMYNTLMNESDGVVTQLQDDVRFGLALYTAPQGGGGTCPLVTQVEPALYNRESLDSTYRAAQPLGETPTGESLELVIDNLDAFAEDGPKAVILATDGDPDTCAVPNPQNGQPESLAAVARAYELGIETFVISVGDQISQTHLQELANVGAGKDVAETTDPAPFYEALNAGALIDAFNLIVGNFVDCKFQVDGEVDLTRYCEGRVELDGVALECDTDWSVTDPTTLELHDSACEVLQDDQPHQLDASFPCDVIDIP